MRYKGGHVTPQMLRGTKPSCSAEWTPNPKPLQVSGMREAIGRFSDKEWLQEGGLQVRTFSLKKSNASSLGYMGSVRLGEERH